MLISNDSFLVKGIFSSWFFHPTNVQNDDLMPYVSYDSPFSYLKIRIKNNQKLFLTGYSLKFFSHITNNEHMLKWAIIGSNDKLNWFIIDEEDLNHKKQEIKINEKMYFNCLSPDSFTYFRLIQTGRNSHGNNIMYLTYLELYGQLKNS